jgi:hypothetical protein
MNNFQHGMMEKVANSFNPYLGALLGLGGGALAGAGGGLIHASTQDKPIFTGGILPGALAGALTGAIGGGVAAKLYNSAQGRIPALANKIRSKMKPEGGVVQRIVKGDGTVINLKPGDLSPSQLLKAEELAEQKAYNLFNAAAGFFPGAAVGSGVLGAYMANRE